MLSFVSSHFCCFNLMVSRCKIEKCDVPLGREGGLRNVTTCDKDGGGVQKSLNLCNVISRWPLIAILIRL